ncbi:MAG: hypothetical protein O7H41_21865 [Planctomycetota bacterium]|nr:hypothetical protein [Planctomycetota bacterium]
MSRSLQAVTFVLITCMTLMVWAQTRAWWSPASQRATDAAFADTDIGVAVKDRLSNDNDLVGIEVTDLGPVTGGKEYEVRLVFDAVGEVPDLGDITAVVFVSTNLATTSVVSFEDPDEFESESAGGGEVNTWIEYQAASAAFADSTVQTAVDARLTAGFQITDIEAIVVGLGAGPGIVIVDVIMDSDSVEPGMGDVTARVEVEGSTATVISVTEE